MISKSKLDKALTLGMPRKYPLTRKSYKEVYGHPFIPPICGLSVSKILKAQLYKMLSSFPSLELKPGPA